MIRTLISLEASLASQIALRYCCRMAQMVPMDIRGIHVEECTGEAGAPGTGWVRQTWENSTLDTARDHIVGMLEALPSDCPISKIPKVAMGVGDEEICSELAVGRYDLFVEGMLHNFDPAGFREKIAAQRFTRSSCPVLIVKNMPAFRKAALLLTPGDRLEPLAAAFARMFTKDAMDIDVIAVKGDLQSGGVSYEAPVGKAAGASPAAGAVTADAARWLTDQGWRLRHCREVEQVGAAAGLLRNYSVVASCQPSDTRRGNPLVKVLSQVPTANLLCCLK